VKQVRGAQYRLKHRNKAIYLADLYVRNGVTSAARATSNHNANSHRSLSRRCRINATTTGTSRSDVAACCRVVSSA